jgi:hypothetical protein
MEILAAGIAVMLLVLFILLSIPYEPPGKRR